MSTTFVGFDAELRPCVAGGAVGKYASELYPLRVDVDGTHQLSHARALADGEAPQKIFLIKSADDSHKFIVRVLRQRARAGKESSLVLPYFEGGAYTMPIDVSLVDDDTSVAASTLVILHVYATSYTETKQRCWVSVGSAMVPIALIVNGADVDACERAEVVQNRDNETGAAPAKPLVKGVFELSKFVAPGITVRPISRFDVDVSSARTSEAAAQMSHVIDRGMLAFFNGAHGRADTAFLSHSTKPFLRPFHCPEFRTDRMPLPASAYAMLMPASELDVPYYEQLVQVALARAGLTEHEGLRLAELALEQRGHEFERHAFATLCTRAMTVFAVSQCYMDDFFNRNVAGKRWKDSDVEGDEDFKLCRLCGGDDCEGCAQEVHMHVRSLQRAPPASVERMSPLLRAVRRYLRLFVSTLTLGAVTNKKLTATQLNQNNVMAHTFAVLVPFWQMYKALDATGQKCLRGSRYYREHADELAPFEPTSDNPRPLTCLVGEGTAPIDPASRPVASYYPTGSDERAHAFEAAAARRAITECVVSALAANDNPAMSEENLGIECFGPPDVGEADYSPFYKYPVSFACAEFADIRTFDWAYTYPAPGGQHTFGIEFRDLVDPGRRIAHEIVPYLVITEDEARTIDAILLDQEPIPTLRLPPSDYRDPEELKFRSTIDSICARAARQSERRAPGTVLHSRQLFMTMRAEDINNKTISALERVACLPGVTSMSHRWWSINAAVDGTTRHNTILDVYLTY